MLSLSLSLSLSPCVSLLPVLFEPLPSLLSLANNPLTLETYPNVLLRIWHANFGSKHCDGPKSQYKIMKNDYTGDVHLFKLLSFQK